MDISVGLDDEFLELDKEWIPAWKKIVPKDGKYLGLDISEESTGVCVIINGEKKTYNIHLEKSDSVHLEVLLRWQLKEKLVSIISGMEFDVIVIEDAFQGVNPLVTRLLYAINTAIDELILEGKVICKDFYRVSNKSWKSWLFTLDKINAFKGLNDKVKIEKCLELVDIYEDGDGYQDRLDATGMLVGFFLRGSADASVLNKKKVVWEDVCLAYEPDEDLAVEYAKVLNDGGSLNKMYVTEKYWSKSKVLRYLTEYPEYVFVSPEPCVLGNFGASCGLPYLDTDGYLAFWINPKKIKKYINEVKEVDYSVV